MHRWRPALPRARSADPDAHDAMSRVGYPKMKRHGYKDTLATGAIASGGTLGILIPPSTVLVICGIITETDIGKLFVAGILAGLVAIACLCLAVV